MHECEAGMWSHHPTWIGVAIDNCKNVIWAGFETLGRIFELGFRILAMTTPWNEASWSHQGQYISSFGYLQLKQGFTRMFLKVYLIYIYRKFKLDMPNNFGEMSNQDQKVHIQQHNLFQGILP